MTIYISYIAVDLLYTSSFASYRLYVIRLTRLLGHLLTHRLRHEGADGRVRLLRLLRCGRLAGADRPNRLVGDHHLAPILTLDSARLGLDVSHRFTLFPSCFCLVSCMLRSILSRFPSKIPLESIDFAAKVLGLQLFDHRVQHPLVHLVRLAVLALFQELADGQHHLRDHPRASKSIKKTMENQQNP